MKDEKIGCATVYRMVNILEDIGAISRKNMYRIECGSEEKNVCMIEFDDNTVIQLTNGIWNQVVQKGLDACGYMKGRNVKSVTMGCCE